MRERELSGPPFKPPLDVKLAKFISYAQNCEDVILWRALQGIPNGRYVDIGANHPLNDSVTHAFYERGWRGVNVEPIRSLYNLLLMARPEDINLCCAISSMPGMQTFYEIEDADGLSTLNKAVAEYHARSGRRVREYEVSVNTIAGICAKHGIEDIHFLKIDVEGAERLVLEGISFDQIRPWIIVVESTKPNTRIPAHEDWENILITNDYAHVYFDGANRYYVSNAHPELLDAFDAPPNAFDNYIQYPAHKQLLDALALSQAEAASYKSRLDEIRASASWKITMPLRAIRQLFSEVLGKLKEILNV